MQNILIGVKRFFKNKNTVTIIGVIVCLGILYFVYDWRIRQATNPTTVAYAKVVIGPRTYITSDMVSTKKVPGELAGKVYTLPKQVIGKYVKNNVVIPVNGLFYTDYIGEWDDISDTIYDSIDNDHTIFALEVTKNNTYGNSIFPGNYIDLYYKQDVGSTGNIVIGKQKFEDVEKRFKAMGFDCAFPPGTPPEETIKVLRELLHMDGEN